MGRGGDTQLDWAPLARRLASRGYLALTYNRRGICPSERAGCSGGVDDLPGGWKDVVGAYRFLHDRGAVAVALVGASIGAMSSIAAAARPDIRVAALVEVGGINDASGYSFRRTDVQRLEGAKLFLSSAADPYGGSDAARQWFAWARAPKELEIVPGHLHGTDLLRAGEASRRGLLQIIPAFLDAHVARGARRG